MGESIEWNLLYVEGFKQNINIIFNFIKNQILDPLSKWLDGVFKVDWVKDFGVIGDYMNAWLANIQNIVAAVKQAFSGIVDFVNGVLSGDWQQAWDGIKNIFGGAWNGMLAIIKSPINGIIGLMNGLLRAAQIMQNGVANALNKMNISVPSWVTSLTGYHPSDSIYQNGVLHISLTLHRVLLSHRTKSSWRYLVTRKAVTTLKHLKALSVRL